MDQKTIARVFEIEERAVKIREDAQQQAKKMLSEAQREVAQERERRLREAQQEAAKIIAEGKRVAQEERKQLLAKAEEEAQHLENQAQQNLERAVEFVLSQVAEG